MNEIYKNKKIASTILLIVLFYVRCVLGIVKGTGVVCANLAIDGIFFLFIALLLIHSEALEQQSIGFKLKKIIVNPAFIWVVIFAAMEFVYGHFNIRIQAIQYSMQFEILTIGPAILLLFWMLLINENIIDIMADVALVVIPATFISVLFMDENIALSISYGVIMRIGDTWEGNLMDTANLYALLLIPIFYKIIVKKEIKKYIIPALVGIAGVFIAAAKSSFIPLVLVCAIFIIGNSKSKKAIIRNLLILLAVGIVLFVLVMKVPILYDVVGWRFAEVFNQMNATEYDLSTSTGQRMAVIAAVKEHFWEAPIFGHGFYAFKQMDYSVLELQFDGYEYSYQHIQTHMNFLELLFSFGLFGFVLYYWFPVLLVIKSFKTKNHEKRMLAFAFMITIFFMDLGLDLFFKQIIPYYVYFIVYSLVKDEE